jgi:putative ABC transport system permease protein
VDRGFRDPEHVLVATVDFVLAGYGSDSLRRTLVEQIVQRVGALPGVRAAAAATFVPLGFVGYAQMDTRVDGYTPRPGESTTFLTNRVSAGYFEAMGVAVVRGRPIGAVDRDGNLPVAVVNEAFARRFWGAAEPIGRRIYVAGREATVVGVAANGKYEFAAPLDDASPPFVYLPFAQWPHYLAVLHVRGAGNPLALLPAIRREVAAVDPQLPLLNPSDLDAYTSVPFFPVRLGSVVLTGLGVAALALAALGLYAVIGYAVTQRQREIGVRMALGATQARVVTTFLAEAARYAGAGALAGVALASVTAGVLVATLPNVVPHSQSTRVAPFAIALGALTTVVLLAAVIPALRAARVSPTTALRAE